MFKRNFKKLAGIVAMLVVINMMIIVPVQADDSSNNGDSRQIVTGTVTDSENKTISGVNITSTKNGNPNNNYDTDTSNGNGRYSIEIHNGAGDICVTKADGYDSYATSVDGFTKYYSINTSSRDVINQNTTVINIKLKSASSGSTGVSINVADSSNQIIEPYVNTAGKSTDTIFSTPVRLATDAKAKITYGFNGVTFSKYKFVEASDLISVPDFPEDSAMTPITLPEPNTSNAYKDDIGKQNYLTTKHYEYAGKAGTTLARNVSFGTPSFDGVFEQEAVTDSTKNPVKYDLGSTNGSNFYVSQKGSNNTSYASTSDTNNSNTIKYGGNYYTKTKYASSKAMKMWGYFVPKQTGTYILGSWSDDGAYGYIIKDGVNQTFVDDWSLKAPFDRTENTPIQLTAGKYYPIYMEWYEGCPTQAAFVPEYKFSVNDSDVSRASFVPIPENELYSSKTTTPGDIAGAYFGDVSGISFPAQDGTYYIATKFKSKEGTTQGLYGPFVIDNTRPVINGLSVSSNNHNGAKWAVHGNTLTIEFSSSENLRGDPQILINSYATNATITKVGNYYTATVNIGNDGSINLDGDKLTEGPITVQVAHYADLNGNEGVAVQDSTVKYDNTAPTAVITYSANPTSVGTEVITATYSEPVKSEETPQISINQPGTTDITTQNMTAVGTDRKVWTYNYTVNADNGKTYEDGIATVTLSAIHDGAGNVAAVPTENTFIINTKSPTVILTFSANPVSVGTEKITATYSKAVKSGYTPQISIDQQGTTDIKTQNMSVGIDRKTWTFNYTVHVANNSTYKDGIATVDLSTVYDDLNKVAASPQVKTFIIDTISPTVAVTYSANPVKAGTELITATYSEPVKGDQIPQISIKQQGTVYITAQPMTSVGTDRTTWTYAYVVNTDDRNTYKDGIATVSLSMAQDEAGNIATSPSGNTFTIDTIAPTLTISMPSSSLARSGPVTYTVTYYGADKVTLESSNVTLDKIGSADGIVTASGTGNTRIVTVSTITGDGLLAIKIAAGTATDTAGNSVSAPLESTSFGVWNSSPIITTPSDGTITNNNKPTITGIGEEGLLVTVYDNNEGAIGTTTVNNVGNWSLLVTDALVDGNHAIVASQSDSFGNVSNDSVAVNITIDTIAPAPVITGPSSGITNNNKPTITGTGEEGALVTVYDNVTAIGTVTVAVGGTWSLILTTGLADGTHAITAIQTDVAGNVSVKSNEANLTVDTTVAAPVITGPASGVTNNNKPTITGTGEAGALVTVYDNNKVAIGTATVNNAGNWSLFVTVALVDGNHAIVATQSDSVGNVSGNSGTVNLKVDTQAPTATITYSISPLNQDVLATLNSSEVITVTNNGGLQTHNFPENGTFTFEFEDGAGNIGTAIATVNNIDRTTIGQHGMFINGAFSTKESPYTIVQGFSGSFGVEFTTSTKNLKLQMEINHNVTISNLKLYEILANGKSRYISAIAGSNKTGTFEITIPNVEDGITHYILAYNGTVNKTATLGIQLINYVYGKVENRTDNPCIIKAVALPDLH